MRGSRASGGERRGGGGGGGKAGTRNRDNNRRQSQSPPSSPFSNGWRGKEGGKQSTTAVLPFLSHFANIHPSIVRSAVSRYMDSCGREGGNLERGGEKGGKREGGETKGWGLIRGSLEGRGDGEAI